MGRSYLVFLLSVMTFIEVAAQVKNDPAEPMPAAGGDKVQNDSILVRALSQWAENTAIVASIEVVEVESYYKKGDAAGTGKIESKVKIRINDYWRGTSSYLSKGNVLTLVVPGGKIDSVVSYSSRAPSFRLNEKGIVALDENLQPAKRSSSFLRFSNNELTVCVNPDETMLESAVKNGCAILRTRDGALTKTPNTFYTLSQTEARKILKTASE